MIRGAIKKKKAKFRTLSEQGGGSDGRGQMSEPPLIGVQKGQNNESNLLRCPKLSRGAGGLRGWDNVRNLAVFFFDGAPNPTKINSQLAVFLHVVSSHMAGRLVYCG